MENFKEASRFKEIPRRSEFISAISHLLISISQCGPQANKHKSSTTDEFHSSDFNSKRQFTAVKHFILTKNKRQILFQLLQTVKNINLISNN